MFAKYLPSLPTTDQTSNHRIRFLHWTLLVSKPGHARFSRSTRFPFIFFVDSFSISLFLVGHKSGFAEASGPTNIPKAQTISQRITILY